jgi:hypothetical protein
MSKPKWLFIGVAWLFTICVVLALLNVARNQVIARLSQPEALAEWRRWQQEEAARQADPHALVKRRPPKSAEPPALVLMRDSFPAVAAAILVVVTLCFAFAVMSLHGLRPTRLPHRPLHRPGE